MKRYTEGQMTITFCPGAGVAAAALGAMLSQLKPGAVIDDMTVDLPPSFTGDLQNPFIGSRRLVITYREPAEKEA